MCGVQGDRAQIILLWALLLAARRSSGRLPAVIGLPCGSVVTGESRSGIAGIAGIEGAAYRSVPRPPRAAWTGLNSVEPVRAGSAGSDVGTPKTRLSTLPIIMPRPAPARTSSGKCAPRYIRDRQTAAASAQGRTFHQPFR